MFRKKGHGDEKTKGGGPCLEQFEGLDGEPDVASIDGVVVVHDGQRPQQQQDHDHIGLGDVADVIINQVPRDTGDSQAIEAGLDKDTGAASSLEYGTATARLKNHDQIPFLLPPHAQQERDPGQNYPRFRALASTASYL
ncbi:hypothetical protein D3C76_929910 [compost metagenome]